jgi:hypothetical protein
MNTIPTDAELIFWIVLLVIAVLFLLALPIIRNAMENSEAKRMLSHYDYEEYHDDMEDVWD